MVNISPTSSHFVIASRADDNRLLFRLSNSPDPLLNTAQLKPPGNIYNFNSSILASTYQDTRTPEQKAYDQARSNDPQYKAASDAYYNANNNPIFDQKYQLERDISSYNFFKGDPFYLSASNKGKTGAQLQQELDTLTNSQAYKDAIKQQNDTQQALGAASDAYSAKNPRPASPKDTASPDDKEKAPVDNREATDIKAQDKAKAAAEQEKGITAKQSTSTESSSASSAAKQSDSAPTALKTDNSGQKQDPPTAPKSTNKTP